MPVVLTYNSLVSQVQAYVERAQASVDPTAYAFIPTAINLTEQKIARELKIQGFIRIVNWTMQADLSVYQKPDRWRENISMAVGTSSTATAAGNTWVPIFTRDYEYVRQVYADPTVTGVPKYYADMDYTHWWISPTPQAPYSAQATYWELPPLLDDANQTNWTSEYAPNALIHGTLVEMYGFLKNADQRGIWSQEYDRDMAALAGEDIQKILDRNQARTTS